MTPFALLLQICGLSTREAAWLFKAQHGVIKSWASGRASVPAAVLAELKWLYGQIIESAALQEEEIRDGLAEYSDLGKPPFIEIKMPNNDLEAQAMGMPCVGAARARAGVLIARLEMAVVIAR